MFAYASEINWIYMFCRQCWTYRRFLFDKPIPWQKIIKIEGKCNQCRFTQMLDVAEATNYYQNLNKNNR